MIGGRDSMIYIRPSPHVRKAIAQKFCVLWPNGMVEYDVLQPLGPDSLSRVEEAFVYEDRKAFDSWAKLGCTDQNENAMVHFTFGKDYIAIVHGEGLAPFIATLTEMLR